jgi:hypothetical protein
MRTTVNYPLLFRAHPGKCIEPKDVLVQYMHTDDVPEISTSETRISFKMGPYLLREYDRRLFSYIGKPGSKTANACFDHGFEPVEGRAQPWWIPLRVRYAAQALDNLIYYRLFLDGGGKARETVLWPPLVPSYSGERGFRSRTEFTFQGLESKLRDIDSDQLYSGRDLHAVEFSKLILIDGDYWIETTPPAICISNGGWKASFAHLPNWLDNDLGRQYFPFDERADAIDYAKRTQQIRARSSDTAKDFSEWMSFVSEENPLFEFDHNAYSAKRTTMLLGGDMARVLAANPELAEKVGSGLTASVNLARDAARECGPDWRAWADTTALTHDVTEAWKMTGRKPGWAEIPAKRHEFGTLICDRATAMVDAMPISVAPAANWRSFP